MGLPESGFVKLIFDFIWKGKQNNQFKIKDQRETNCYWRRGKKRVIRPKVETFNSKCLKRTIKKSWYRVECRPKDQKGCGL